MAVTRGRLTLYVIAVSILTIIIFLYDRTSSKLLKTGLPHGSLPLWTPKTETSDNFIPNNMTTFLENSSRPIKKTSVVRPTQSRAQPNKLKSSVPTQSLVVLPRSAYLDNTFHTPSKKCKNLTVILVAVSKAAVKNNLVTGCESEGYVTREFKVETFIQYGWVHRAHPDISHDGAKVNCCNLPVRNGSSVFVLYKEKRNQPEKKIESERKLFISPKAPTNSQGKTSEQKPLLVVCVTVYGKPSWLREWLIYQQTIGVDHIHLYAQTSFVTEGSANTPILQEYLNTSYATLDIWEAHLSRSQIFYYQQVLFYQDCLYRHRNIFDYALLYDTDDFFIPCVPGKPDIHFYIPKIFTSSGISSALFNWKRYLPFCGSYTLNLTRDASTIFDGNITRYLATYKYDQSRNAKAMHKLSLVKETGVHEALVMAHGSRKVWVQDSLAYVAHMRAKQKNRNPCQELTTT